MLRILTFLAVELIIVAPVPDSLLLSPLIDGFCMHPGVLATLLRFGNSLKVREIFSQPLS